MSLLNLLGYYNLPVFASRPNCCYAWQTSLVQRTSQMSLAGKGRVILISKRVTLTKPISTIGSAL